MKCIKLIKESKNNDLGTIIRVTDTEADTRVKSGSWAFVPKSDYKKFLYPEGKESVKPEKEKKKK